MSAESTVADPIDGSASTDAKPSRTRSILLVCNGSYYV